MKGRTGAAVINVASISGWSPQLAMSGQYGAAKAALIFDTERWALEFVPHGIRVNTVSPGSILVAGNGWDRYRLANQEYFDDYVRHGFPMGRLGTAEEVADVIAFLASPRAHWINGRNIPVDGLEQPHAPFDDPPLAAVGARVEAQGVLRPDPARRFPLLTGVGAFWRENLGYCRRLSLAALAGAKPIRRKVALHHQRNIRLRLKPKPHASHGRRWDWPFQELPKKVNRPLPFMIMPDVFQASQIRHRRATASLICAQKQVN
jgi:hypothetical protein